MSIPVPTLDDKQFEALVADGKLLIPRYAPTWTDHNLHDPGITLLELFAWLAETQIFTLDQVTERHVRKFLRLLGFDPRPAAAAIATVQLTLPEGALPVFVPSGTQLVGRRAGSDEDIPFETERDAWVVANELVRVERLSLGGRMDLTEVWKRELFFFPLGGEAGEPLEEGVSVRLGFSRPFPPREVSLGVELYEADLPPVGAHGEEPPDVTPSALVEWEYLTLGDHWAPLPGVVDGTRALTESGVVRFTGPLDALGIPEGGKTLYWLRCRLTQPGHEILPRISAVRLNTVTAVEGRTVSPRIVGSGSGLPSQRLEVGDAPLLRDSVSLQVQGAPAGLWELWTQVPDLDASGPADSHYVLEPEAGTIMFGDGLRGRLVPKGADIQAGYRVGGGGRGNLSAGGIRRIPGVGFENLTVSNPGPAGGGREPELLGEVWRRVKTDLATPSRAVTTEDFEALARATPGLRVARAKALPGFDGNEENHSESYAVTVVVLPYSLAACPLPSEGFRKTVCRHLDRHRLITTEVRVLGPAFVPLTVETDVIVKPRSSPEEVRKRVEQAVAEYLHPLRGGAKGGGWPFGRWVHRSELAHRVERVEGVDCLERLQLLAQGGRVGPGGEVEVPPDALPCPVRVSVEAKERGPLCERKPCQPRAQT